MKKLKSYTMFFRPPGTGKTSIGKSIANAWEENLLESR